MYAVMALAAEKYETAETFFEAATSAEERNVIAWTMLGKLLVSYCLALRLKCCM